MPMQRIFDRNRQYTICDF